MHFFCEVRVMKWQRKADITFCRVISSGVEEEEKSNEHDESEGTGPPNRV